MFTNLLSELVRNTPLNQLISLCQNKKFSEKIKKTPLSQLLSLSEETKWSEVIKIIHLNELISLCEEKKWSEVIKFHQIHRNLEYFLYPVQVSRVPLWSYKSTVVYFLLTANDLTLIQEIFPKNEIIPFKDEYIHPYILSIYLSSSEEIISHLSSTAEKVISTEEAIQSIARFVNLRADAYNNHTFPDSKEVSISEERITNILKGYISEHNLREMISLFGRMKRCNDEKKYSHLNLMNYNDAHLKLDSSEYRITALYKTFFDEKAQDAFAHLLQLDNSHVLFNLRVYDGYEFLMWPVFYYVFKATDEASLPFKKMLIDKYKTLPPLSFQLGQAHPYLMLKIIRCNTPDSFIDDDILKLFTPPNVEMYKQISSVDNSALQDEIIQHPRIILGVMSSIEASNRIGCLKTILCRFTSSSCLLVLNDYKLFHCLIWRDITPSFTQNNAFLAIQYLTNQESLNEQPNELLNNKQKQKMIDDLYQGTASKEVFSQLEHQLTEYHNTLKNPSHKTLKKQDIEIEPRPNKKPRLINSQIVTSLIKNKDSAPSK